MQSVLCHVVAGGTFGTRSPTRSIALRDDSGCIRFGARLDDTGLMRLLEVVLPGDPVPKERPRRGDGGATYTPEKTRDAETVVQYRLLSHRLPSWPALGPVGIAVEFYCATRIRKDGDNLLKLVSDAMNGLVYGDDSQIEEWFCRVHRGVGAQQARTELYVHTLQS